MKTLGVIGGLGPMATAYFLQLVVQMTNANKDQEHLDVTILNRPSIPDRTSYILDRTKPSPLPPICEAAKQLEDMGCCCIAIPCITSHYFFEEFSASVKIPFVNIVEETAAYLKARGVKKAGILATIGTVRSGLFQRALEKQGIAYVLPDEEGQKLVMELIYDDVKAGKPVELGKFEKVSQMLRKMGSECNILGCTELSLIKRDYPLGSGFLDAMEVLAHASVLKCGKQIKPEYDELISK